MDRNSEPVGPASPWVVRWAAGFPAECSVLDVAAGRGRHTRYLLDAGHGVCAVDRDPGGLEDLAGQTGFELVTADLEEGPWPFDGRSFDAVVVTNYLWRPLVPRLFEVVAANGCLVYETFMRGHEAYGRPRRPDFLLEPDELLAAVPPGFRVAGFEQGLVRGASGPAMVQRIAVFRTADPMARIDAERAREPR